MTRSVFTIIAVTLIFAAAVGGAFALGIIAGPFESKEQLLPAAHDPKFYNDLGYYLSQEGKNTDAQAAFAHAVALKPDYERARSNLATIAFQNKEYTTAISNLRWLTEHYPQNAGYAFDLAQNLVYQARYVDADLAKLNEAASIYESLGSYPNAAENAVVVHNVIADVTA